MAGAADAVIAGAIVFLAVLAGIAFVAGVVLWRRVRRRWRMFRDHALVRGAWAMVDSAALRSVRGMGSSGAVLALPPRQARWQMWRSVAAAERSVRDAETVGAPTADLPSLCRRLHAAADDVDRLLAMGRHLDPHSTAAADVRRQLGEVVAAADHINGAAVASASGTMAPRLHSLAADAEQELDALAHGLRRIDPLPGG